MSRQRQVFNVEASGVLSEKRLVLSSLSSFRFVRPNTVWFENSENSAVKSMSSQCQVFNVDASCLVTGRCLVFLCLVWAHLRVSCGF